MTADPDLLWRLPHRPPMLLLESVREADDQGGTALARVDPGAWYADSAGAMPAWFGLELMAQAIAACRGHRGAPGGPARGGYLVAARSFRSSLPAFATGALLEVRVRLELEDPSGLCGFLGEIIQERQVVAKANLRVMELP
jgi:predicted hotdog family 3-hydroxylacyl-ACP dehydratase